MLLAVGASAAVHLVVLTVVLLTIDTRQPDRGSPTIIVSLTPAIAPPERPKTVRPRSDARRRATAPLNPPATAPLVQAAKGVVANMSNDQDVTAPQSEALGESVRCAHPNAFDMDSAERERCRQRDHDLARGAPTYAALPADPTKAAAFERAAGRNGPGAPIAAADAWTTIQACCRCSQAPTRVRPARCAGIICRSGETTAWRSKPLPPALANGDFARYPAMLLGMGGEAWPS
jgi:hypothetical protein